MEVRKIDSLLLGAIQHSSGFPNVPYDLKKVRVLDQFIACGYLWPDVRHPRDWMETETGEFGLIGEMPNLHTLVFPSGRVADGCLHINDFSFLKRCKKLKKLDVSGTNFTDCALLIELPALRWVFLPPQKQLIHPEALEGLKAKVLFAERSWEQPAKLLQPIPVGVPVAVPFVLPQTSARIENLAEELRRLSGKEAYRLLTDAARTPGLFDSKFGGLPYWDFSKPYPKDLVRQPMQLLAQLNFETLGVGVPFPDHGMLQFFIPQQDELFGCRFGEPTGDFRIVYHERIDSSITPEAVLAKGIPAGPCGQSPVFAERAVYAEPRTSYINDRAPEIETVFRTAVRNAWGEELSNEYSYEYLDDDDYNALFDALTDQSDGSMNGGHWMLGYPSFTQEDPREEGSPYDTLLLQIDSVLEGNQYSILWGDCGVANFFIRREDLEKRDFSRVLYNWDCC